jgi:hypothetical protein
LLPTAFEAVEESGFDFGCDVAVDLDESVGEVVAEASCLGDFGDAVGDEPGFVAVPEAVEGQSGLYWLGAFAVVAVDAGSEDPAVEGAAP